MNTVRWVEIASPRKILLATALLLLFATPGLLRLELRTDGKALVPRDDPAVLFDAEIREHFGLYDPIVVTIETDHSDGIYNFETLDRIRDLTEAVVALDEIEARQVTSLATEHSDRVDAVGGVRFKRYLEALPETAQELTEADTERLRGDFEAVDIFFGTLISFDRRSSALLVGAPPTTDERFDRTALCLKITEIARSHADENHRVSVVGAPVAEALLGLHLLEDLALLLPLTISLMAVVLFVGCGNLWGTLLGLGEIGACLIWTFGVMGWMGSPVYLTTAILPVILVTIGLADEIHVFWHYQKVIDRGDPPSVEDPIRVAMDEMTRPVVMTSLTTIVGFLSFLASPIPAVRAFGVYAPVGILFCLFWTLATVPAFFRLLPPERFVSRFKRRRFLFGDLLAACYQRPRRTLATLAVLTLLFATGIKDLLVQDSWIDGFAESSEFYQATQRLDEQFFGAHLLLVRLDLEPPQEEIKRIYYGEPGPLLLPDHLRRIEAFEEFAREQPGVGGVLGPASHLKTVSFLRYGRREEKRVFPETPQKVDHLLRRFDQSRSPERRREVIDDDRSRAIVTLFLKDANYRETEALLAALREEASRSLEPHGVRIEFAGDVAVSQAMIPAIVESQVSSLLLALGGALLILSLLLRSFRRALWVSAPVVFTIVWVFGWMGITGMPLGVATSMFCAVTLGIGVDYAIHFTESLRRRSEDPDPVLAAARETGPAICVDAVAVALGFGLLMVSQVPANARLGLLTAVALGTTCIWTLVGLGALKRLLGSQN